MPEPLSVGENNNRIRRPVSTRLIEWTGVFLQEGCWGYVVQLLARYVANVAGQSRRGGFSMVFEDRL